MYINSIDTILEHILDNSYEIILKSKTFSSILKIANFTDKYENIVKMLVDFIKEIDWSVINKNFPDETKRKTVIGIIKKYIAYYTFIAIGYFYDDKMDTYKNNMIEFGKMVNKSMIDIPNFFTSESNSNVFSTTELVRSIHEILDDDKIRQRKKIEPKYYEALKFLDEVGEEFTNTYLKITPKQKDKLMQCHQIIKSVITKIIYSRIDKPEILKLLETLDIDAGETIYIDVSFPIDASIDITEIEATLTPEEVEQGIARNIYDILVQGTQLSQQYFAQPIDMKITDLINSGLIVPICEDFLLYHDNNEKYESPKTDPKQREQQKIRYILDKIISVENTDINDTDAIRKNKNLSTVFSSRLAMTVNENENVRIIDKLMSNGSKVSESVESGNELINYIKYPYVNFKTFRKNGFPVIVEKTVPLIRSISFDNMGLLTQSRNNNIQLRVGSLGQNLNIVGFMIPSKKQPIECLRIKDVSEISGGYENFLQTLSDNVFGKKVDNAYWYFNLKEDVTKITTYEHFDSMEQSEQCKILGGKIRDEIVDIVHQNIIKELRKFEELSFYDAFRIISHLMNSSFQIPETDPKFLEINKVIFHELYQKYVPRHDVNEDTIYGMFGDIKKLPSAPEKKRDNVLRIDTTPSKHFEVIVRDVISDEGICQHFVTWDNILAQKNISVSKYIDALYDFMQQYIMENDEMDYVCKSCGSVLNIKKYVEDGAYDSSTQKFVAFSIPMSVSLEDLPEYRKFGVAIKNLDRLIDQKLANILNIPFLMGHSTTQRIKRNTMVKDAIDLILLNNSYLNKRDMKQRAERASNLYGIDRDLTNLFKFEFDNSIFIYTSDDKDYYKFLKYNNVIAYVIFLILLELNENQISIIASDRICNYSLYEKFGEKTMGDLKIRFNNKDEVKSILEYPVLSFVLYVMTCILSKYSIWYVKDVPATKKVNPTSQKIMIHTVVDIINNVLESAESNKNKRVYDIIRTKFYQQLTSTYSNKIFMETMHENNTLNTRKSDLGGKKDLVDRIKIVNEYSQMKMEHIEYAKYINYKFFPKSVAYDIKQSIINNLTHCPTGVAHSFVIDKENNKRVKCMFCGLHLDEAKYNEKQTENILSAIEVRQLEKIGDYYCLTGQPHNYVFNHKTQSNICKRCKYVYGDYLPEDKLKQLKKLVFAPKIIKDITVADKKKEKHDLFVANVLKTLRTTYVESKTHRDDYYKFIDTFMSLIQSEVGDVVNIDGMMVHLNDDMYTISHNHLGYPLQPPVVVSGKGPEISFKKGHTFYKCDVIIYHIEKGIKLNVFYDANTYVLLGYKELNKDFVLNIKTENRIKIDYSVKNMIRYLGSSAKYIDTKHNITYQEQSDDSIVAISSRERISHIGNIIHKLIVSLNRIKTHMKDGEEENKENNIDAPVSFNTDKYLRKLQLIQLRQDKNKAFRLWDLIVKSLHYFGTAKTGIRLEKTNNFVEIDDIINHDYAGNLLLFYFISELTNLLKINQNKYIKKTLTEFIIDFIIYSFNEYNIDRVASNNELSRFEMILESNEYWKDLEKTGFGMDAFVEVFEEKTKEQLEEEDYDKEANEALDMEGTIDNEDEYEAGYTEREYRWEFDVKAQELELN